MADELERAQLYLCPPPHRIWQWAERGEVITWHDGVTIVFRAELLEVVRHLAPQGLPPLGAIVFLLAACRQSWPEASEKVASLAGQVASVTRRGIPGWLPDVMQGLDRVADLPTEVRNSTELKGILAEIVFENVAGRTSPVITQAVLRLLEVGWPDEERKYPEETGLLATDLLSELQSLHPGLERVDPATIELRRRTGLDDLVQPAELDWERADQARRLIVSLQDDPEVGGVARIAQHLMAAIHLPRSVSDPEDLPVGGVSDITNRGSLDRLLLSELAYDEMTLAVRIALREALYLRRESPPRTPPQHRAVLIDVGLRMWGLPRVFAAGVALALAAGGKRQIKVDAFQSQGKSAVAVDLATRDGLVKHLESLQPDAHPGDALDSFLLAASSEGPPREVLLVTGADVLNDPQFQKALAVWNVPTVYLAAVDREGHFKLLVRSGRGTRLVCQAHLDLDSLLKPRSPRRVPLVDQHASRDLPAIFDAKPFPLLLPHPIDPTRMWPADEHGVLAVTRDRRLMYWERGGQAARQLTDQFPFAGTVVWYKRNPVTHSVLAVISRGSHGPCCLVNVVSEQGEFTTVMLDIAPRGHVNYCEYQGVLFALHEGGLKKGAVEALDIQSGRVLDSCARIPDSYPRLWPTHGRVFPCLNGRWVALSWDGQKICWDEVVGSELAKQLKPGMGLYVPDNYEGFLGLTLEGEIFFSREQRYCRILPSTTGRYVPLASAMDGQVLLVGETVNSLRVWRVDLPDCKVTRLTRSKTVAEMLLRNQLTPTVWSKTLPWHYREVFGGGTSLMLVTGKGIRWRFELDDKGTALRMKRGKDDDTLTGVPSRLKTVARESAAGLELRLAQWADGSRAWVDSRGLLHLRSSDPVLPELTLVLYESHVSGWCSDGRTFGSKYFLGAPATAAASEIARSVLYPFLARLR